VCWSGTAPKMLDVGMLRHCAAPRRH
jgi:hypothetical protein